MAKGKPKIQYIDGDEGLLDQISVLWQALNQHHLCLSKDFRQHYQEMTFEKRKAALLEKAKAGKMRVDLAVDVSSGQSVGYCVSSVSKFKVGEIESIFVDETFRGFGVGDVLISKAMAWMDREGAESKIVEVAAGNEDAFGFYARYGFRPRKTVLKQLETAHQLGAKNEVQK